MEDAATAEISRSQVWQWIRHGRVDRADVERIIVEVMAELPDEPVYREARDVFEKVALRGGLRRLPHADGVRTAASRDERR